MPVLEITAENLSDPLTLEYVKAVMLWPADAEQRAEYMRFARAQLFTRNVRCAAGDELKQLFELALEATPARVMGPKMKACIERGGLAGALLGTAVLEHALTGTMKLESLKRQLISPSKRKAHRAFDISRSTLEKAVWRDFKRALPLWAASVNFPINDEGDFTFPCPPGRLSRFLAWAEFFRREATSIRSDRRAEPLLIEDQLWVLPPGLPLERIELRRGALGD